MFFSAGASPAPGDTRPGGGTGQTVGPRSHRQAVDRCRFQTLQSRFAKFVDLWDRGQRAREEGRPGPFVQPPPRETSRRAEQQESKVLNVTAFRDPMREVDKLHTLYDSLMDARRQVGEDVVPFHKFAALVKDQVSKLRESGSAEVAFRVAVKEGKVNFTARAMKLPTEP